MELVARVVALSGKQPRSQDHAPSCWQLPSARDRTLEAGCVGLVGKEVVLGKQFLGTPEPLSYRIPSPGMSWEVFDSTFGRQKAEAKQCTDRNRVPLEVVLASGRHLCVHPSMQ